MRSSVREPLVVKIGGSLSQRGEVARVLALVAATRRRIVVVPGGGVHADRVRERQAREGLSDRDAHRLAIEAMEQTGREYLALQPELVAAHTLSSIREAWRRWQVPVWMPARMCARDTRIPEDWSITSDGLAARLAEQLGSVPVLIVKSLRVPRSVRAEALAALGIIDPAFAAIVRRTGLRWRIAGPGEERIALEGLFH